jgi:FkbM family methyltransferase
VLERTSFAGKILRSALNSIPRDSEVRILRGPLRGKKWVVGAATHGCWTGTYEVARLQNFGSAIHPGDCVYDIGANVGIYSLLACEKAGPKSAVYSFEPVERNLRYLRRHVAMNGLDQCHIKAVAVSNDVGTVRFSAAGRENSMGKISSDGELLIPTITLDDSIYHKKELQPPKVMKIDVEGAETQVLQGAARALSQFHPSLFIEIHGVQQHANCRDMLLALGYTLIEEYGFITAKWKA